METLKTERGTIAGGISVLMIFLTLCVAIYSLLSLLTAENELSLNQKNRDAARDYYAADALAVAVISEVVSSETRSGMRVSIIGQIPIAYDTETDTAGFVVPIDKFRNLDVSLAFRDDDSYEYEVIKYRVTNSLDWQEQARGKMTVLTEFD